MAIVRFEDLLVCLLAILGKLIVEQVCKGDYLTSFEGRQLKDLNMNSNVTLRMLLNRFEKR
jgi:hypothetical protein